MGYFSKARILIKGPAKHVENVLQSIGDRGQVVSIPGNQDYGRGDHWQRIYQSVKPFSPSEDGDSVLHSDTEWFKAYDDWDQVVEALKALCDEYELTFSYARMGEMENDFDSDSNDPEGHIFLTRDFTMPSVFK